MLLQERGFEKYPVSQKIAYIPPESAKQRRLHSETLSAPRDADAPTGLRRVHAKTNGFSSSAVNNCFKAFSALHPYADSNRIVLPPPNHGTLGKHDESEQLRRMIVTIETVSSAVREGDDPNAITRNAAQKTVAELYALLHNSGRVWKNPNVTASATGEVVMEWWNGSRKLTAYIGDAGAFEFVRVWGADIGSEMHDGVADTDTERIALWDWLYASI